jgi:hypothetical protein
MWNCHPFRRAKIALHKMSAAQKILVQHFGRVNTAHLSELLCTEKKKKKFQMFA